MRLLFFDMEFANGSVKGSVYSIGYLITDAHFRVLTPPTDLLISPACEWNEYVKRNILAYPEKAVEESPEFSKRYEEIAALFASVDVAVGFSVGNDVRALRADCVRYALPPILFRWFDVEKLCKRVEAHREAHGLDGCFAAWCQGEAPMRHRSDGDALATMRVMEEICKSMRADAEMLIAAYPECAGRVGEIETKTRRGKGRRGHRPYANKKKRETRTKGKETENG